MLDELDPEIRRNFERRGWLPLLGINHPPSAILIRKIYSHLSIHSIDSNTQYVITPLAVASALDDIISYLTSTSI